MTLPSEYCVYGSTVSTHTTQYVPPFGGAVGVGHDASRCTMRSDWRCAPALFFLCGSCYGEKEGRRTTHSTHGRKVLAYLLSAFWGEGGETGREQRSVARNFQGRAWFLTTTHGPAWRDSDGGLAHQIMMMCGLSCVCVVSMVRGDEKQERNAMSRGRPRPSKIQQHTQDIDAIVVMRRRRRRRELPQDRRGHQRGPRRGPGRRTGLADGRQPRMRQ